MTSLHVCRRHVAISSVLSCHACRAVPPSHHGSKAFLLERRYRTRGLSHITMDSRCSLAAARAKLDESFIMLAWTCMRKWEWPFTQWDVSYLLFFDCCVEAARSMDPLKDIVRVACQDSMKLMEGPAPWNCFNPRSDKWREHYGTVPPPWRARPGTLPGWATDTWEEYKIHQPDLFMVRFPSRLREVIDLPNQTVHSAGYRTSGLTERTAGCRPR